MLFFLLLIDLADNGLFIIIIATMYLIMFAYVYTYAYACLYINGMSDSSDTRTGERNQDYLIIIK